MFSSLMLVMDWMNGNSGGFNDGLSDIRGHLTDMN